VSRSTCKTNPSNAKPQEPKICNSNPTPNIKHEPISGKKTHLQFKTQNSETKHKRLNLKKFKINISIETP
jgi:hypothetical protein